MILVKIEPQRQANLQPSIQGQPRSPPSSLVREQSPDLHEHPVLLKADRPGE